MTWQARAEPAGSGCARLRVFTRDGALSRAEAIESWTGDARFAEWFSQLLADAAFASFCWECPPLTRSSLSRAFEFVLVDEPALARMRADPEPFAEPFSRCHPGASVASFENLGGDAFLVAPLPIDATSAYSNLAAFVRTAPASQRTALWQAVGAAVTRKVGDQTLWLSTAGLGVPWLHVRLDRRPKYYRFAEYR